MLRWFKGSGHTEQKSQRLPTVKFDRALVTATVKADLLANIEAIEDIDSPHIEPIYRAATEAVSRGGDLHLLTNAIVELDIPGIDRARAANMARWLSRSASALISDQRQAAMGIESAKWRYSGALCHSGGASASVAQLRQDAAHRGANGKVYRVGKGMLLDGKWTLPGRERARQEREMAAKYDDQTVSLAHLKLAEEYEKRVEGHEPEMRVANG